jgi:hypothetical protein
LPSNCGPSSRRRGEGTLPRGSAVLLGHLEILAQQIGGEEPLDLLVPRSSVEQTVAASHGCDIPPFEGLHDFKTWAEEAPPKGTIYHYPPRGDVEMVIPYSPAPAGIANQISAQATAQKMIAKYTVEGQSIDQAIAWAASELEGFSRILTRTVYRSDPRRLFQNRIAPSNSCITC